MFIQWWRINAPLVGTAAQWIGGLASAGTLLVAFYGLSKAVPYFENLNLRETNAQLQLGNRALEDEKKRIEAELGKIREESEENRKWARHSGILTNCFALDPGLYDRINAASVRTLNALALIDVDRKMIPNGVDLTGPRVKLRALLDVMMDDKKNHWPEEDYERSRAAWKSVAERYGEKLDLVLFPEPSLEIDQPRRSLKKRRETLPLPNSFEMISSAHV